MSFDEEWAEIKAGVAARMQLNGAPAAGGSCQLKVRQDDLGAVGHEAFLLHGQVKAAGALGSGGAKSSTERAAAQLQQHAFGLGAELGRTAGLWDSQVKTVLQGCAHISNHLDHSKKLHAEGDAEVAVSMRLKDGSAMPVSKISKLIH